MTILPWHGIDILSKTFYSFIWENIRVPYIKLSSLESKYFRCWQKRHSYNSRHQERYMLDGQTDRHCLLQYSLAWFYLNQFFRHYYTKRNFQLVFVFHIDIWQRCRKIRNLSRSEMPEYEKWQKDMFKMFATRGALCWMDVRTDR